MHVDVHHVIWFPPTSFHFQFKGISEDHITTVNSYASVFFRFIKGYMTRGQAKTTDNSEYLAFVRQNYLNRLKANLPKTVLDKTTWQTPPPVLTEVLTYLHVPYG